MTVSTRPLSGDPSWSHSANGQYCDGSLNASSWAQHTVRPNKPKRQSWQQRKVYCRAKQGDQEVVQALKRLELPWQSVF